MKLRVAAFALFSLFVAVSTNAFSQDKAAGLSPDRSEIESASSSGIVFVSYEGPSSRIDSLAEIKGIGSGLGRSLGAAIAASAQSPARSGDDRRYLLIRAIDPSVKEGLDADIIVLGPDSQVDHIRNLRWIVASYLVSAWGYSEKDASTLATFVTIYNAVHRGDLKYFASKYKPVVQKELSAENAGLALKYTEWPGKTRIVVPLSRGANSGSLGAIDTGAVSDQAVKESLKAQPDKGVADRQALVDVKEREAAQKQADADKKAADAAAAEQKLAQDKAKAEADRAALEKEKAAAAQTAASPAAAPAAASGAQPAPADKVAPPVAPTAAPALAATASPNAASSPATADKAAGSGAPPATLSTKEAAVAAEEQSVKAQEAQVAAKKEDAAASQAAATAKKEEAAADRKDITADQKTVIATEVAKKGEAAAAGVFLVSVVDDRAGLGQILLVDTDKGASIRSSRINSLHLRSLSELPDSFVAVSGLEGKAGGIKLEKLDKTSLESVAEGKADMYSESAILVQGESLYAMVKAADGKYYIAKFASADLSEKSRSKETVMAYSLIREASGNIAVQSPDGSFLLLSPDTLEKVKSLNP
jgi:hypothetical protein